MAEATTETQLRDDIARIALSLFERGLTHGSTGNISARLPDGGWLMTPTGSSFGALDPARISKLDAGGAHVAGDAPTKEAFLHTTMYAERPDAGAVVHLHSTHSVAVSCIHGVDAEDCLPPLTAYYVMRVGKLPIAPYYPPGDAALAEAVGKLVA
ncbi:MAG: class II aldolase/adducin family protein, partial [Pseudomonadota bacterium]